MATRSGGTGVPLPPRNLRHCMWCASRGLVTKACPRCGRYRGPLVAYSETIWTEAEQRAAWGDR